MKTDTNTPTSSAANAHDGQTAADTKKKYEVTLFWTQHNIGEVIIEADSLAEAEEMADEIESDEIDDWNPTDGEIWVDSVEPIEGGQDNE
ncbi:MAG: hypothetical protein ABSA83_21590 [Verrucomicrobiota bacterium]|jgi:hypothetical protein